jgi:hypothetical protein
MWHHLLQVSKLPLPALIIKKILAQNDTPKHTRITAIAVVMLKKVNVMYPLYIDSCGEIRINSITLVQAHGCRLQFRAMS